MKVLVAGASGFVGSRLCPALDEAGHAVRAMTRHPDNYRGVGEPVRADVTDPKTLDAAAQGCGAAYYLVHLLARASFEKDDAAAARAFGSAASRAGLSQIIYLGGLGRDDDNLSTRQLVEHLPAMVTPRWVRTRTQPIAVADVVRYLVAVLGMPDAMGRAFEIGGPDVLEYVEMMRRVAALEGRRRIVIPVPLLTPSLSARWLSLVTDVDTRTGRSLVDSMINEVIVHDDSIRELVPFELMDYDAAVLQALGERAKAARS